MCIFTLIPLVSSSQISKQSYKKLAEQEASFYANNGDYHYLEPLSNEANTVAFSNKNKIAVQAKIYYTSDFFAVIPLLEKYTLGTLSKEYVTNYCTEFNKCIDSYIKENDKKIPTK